MPITDRALYLEYDVKNAQTMSIDNYLRHVFGCDERWEARRRSSWEVAGKNDVVLQLLQNFLEATGLETVRSAPFVDLGNAIWDTLGHTTVRFCQNDNTFISGSHASCKPDIVVVRTSSLSDSRTVASCNVSGPDVPFWWSEILAFNEFASEAWIATDDDTESASNSRKRTAGQTAAGSKRQKIEIFNGCCEPQLNSSSTRQQSASHSKPPKFRISPARRVQCARYALEMAVNGGFRDFMLGMFTQSETLTLMHFDNSAVIFSEPHSIENVHDSVLQLARILDAMAHSNWGISPLMRPVENITLPVEMPRAPRYPLFSGAELSLANGSFVLELGKVLRHPHGILGRGTFVLLGTIVKASGEGVETGSLCVVKVSRPALTRLSEMDLVERARGLASSRSKDEWVLNHLPNILHFTKIGQTEIQTRLAAFLGDKYEERGLYVVVMSQLHSLEELSDSAEVTIVFRGIFKCYRWLYKDAGILHRDLSMGNLMFRREGDAVYGVLNDFDQAIIDTNERGPSSNQRTGTTPYMAIDLLEKSPPPVHLYRHDLESLYYVLVHVVCSFEHPSVKAWFAYSGTALADNKRAFFTHVAPTPRAGFKAFSRWLKPLHTAFLEGILTQTKQLVTEGDAEASDPPVAHAYDDATMGGKVSFEIFEIIFKKALGESTSSS